MEFGSTLIKLLFFINIALCSFQGDECDHWLLRNLISRLDKSVQYIVDHEHEMNLDGVLSSAILVDQMDVFIKRPAMLNVPEDLKMLLNNITITSTKITEMAKSRMEEIEYYALGPVLDSGSWKLDYPLRKVNRTLIDNTPLTCEDINWSRELSDSCISELVNFREEDGNVCYLSSLCWDQMTHIGFKDYPLTHEVLYLMFGEMHGCFKTFGEPLTTKTKYLQEYFCANVLRDAEELARNGFPDSLQDLFLEQIGLCSMYGYTDFLKRHWIETILSWSEENGCFVLPNQDFVLCSDEKDKLRKRRRKRENVNLLDGCSSHMTSMGVLAMLMETRLCIENIYGGIDNIIN